ncbi:MAG: hypothetical protein NZ529_09605 [Cytophagaceae bacterium]|nr:hypothetical protein [Cytophagaceae bacterium]MDW8457041.1 hypothetical protein [Cytophagaceae bacterium]
MDYEFTDKCTTSWGGMLPMKRLLDKTGIGKILEELGLPEGRSNHRIKVLKMSVPLQRRLWFDGLFSNIKPSPWPLSLQT